MHMNTWVPVSRGCDIRVGLKISDYCSVICVTLNELFSLSVPPLSYLLNGLANAGQLGPLGIQCWGVSLIQWIAARREQPSAKGQEASQKEGIRRVSLLDLNSGQVIWGRIHRSVGFAAACGLVGERAGDHGWRQSWKGQGRSQG